MTNGFAISMHCAQEGARRGTLRAIAAHQVNLVHPLDLREGERVSMTRIEAAAGQWSLPSGRRCSRPARPDARQRFFGHAVRWLRFVDLFEQPCKAQHAHVGEVAVFAAWMRKERGWSEDTIRGSRSTITRSVFAPSSGSPNASAGAHRERNTLCRRVRPRLFSPTAMAHLWSRAPFGSRLPSCSRRPGSTTTRTTDSAPPLSTVAFANQEAGARCKTGIVTVLGVELYREARLSAAIANHRRSARTTELSIWRSETVQ